jgi:hypothetical protein
MQKKIVEEVEITPEEVPQYQEDFCPFGAEMDSQIVITLRFLM